MDVRYSVMLEENSTRVRAEIRRVFFEIWDPIRIKEEPNAQDEYDRYIGPIFDLLMNRGSDKQIFDHLLWATDRMGMDGSRVSLQVVVAALRAFDLER